MTYFLAFLLVFMLLLILRGKRQLDSMYALLRDFEKEREIRKREQEVEQLVKRFALK